MSAGKKNDNLGEFYVGRRRPLPPPRRVLPRGLLTTLFLLSFIGIIWYAYPEGDEKYNDIDIPTIQADVSPYKFKPDDPGGMNVPYQDSTIFDPLENKTGDVGKVEKFMPEPEAPIKKEEIPPIPLEEPKLNLDKKMEAIAPGTEKVVLTKPEPEKPVERVAKIAEEGKSETTTVPKMPAVKPLEKPTRTTSNTTPNALKTEPVERVLLQSTTASPVDWTVHVRLGSYTSPEKAEMDWKRFSNKYKTLLSGLNKRIVPADLGAKGMYYRLEAGTLPESEAKKVCAEISKSKVGGCLVVK